MRRVILVIVLFAFAAHARGAAFDTKTASFAVTFHGEASAYRDTTLTALPGASVIIDGVGGPPGDYAATTRDGILVQQGLRQWKWTAPERP